MEVIEAPGAVRTIMLYFGRGEDILEELQAFLDEEDVDAALITSGIGSFDVCNLHTITKTGLPSEDRYFELKGPIEVGSMQGTVAGGDPHIHVVVHDTANDEVHGGHLEPGTRCCYRVEMGLIILEDVWTQRLTDPDTGLTDVVQVEG